MRVESLHRTARPRAVLHRAAPRRRDEHDASDIARDRRRRDRRGGRRARRARRSSSRPTDPAGSAVRTTCAPGTDRGRSTTAPADGSPTGSRSAAATGSSAATPRRSPSSSATCELPVYERMAVVRLGSLGLTVPYPLQAHVDALGRGDAQRSRATSSRRGQAPTRRRPTLGAGCSASFGPTLCDLFFVPFHDRYTAGLTDQIAPQDAYKSPASPGNRGYNTSFRYPVGGLDRLAQRLADALRHPLRQRGSSASTPPRSSVSSATGRELRLRAAALDAAARPGRRDGRRVDVDEPTRPVHLGARAEHRRRTRAECPDCSLAVRARFARPASIASASTATSTPTSCPADRRDGSHVSMYVERAFPGGRRPGTTRGRARTPSR